MVTAIKAAQEADPSFLKRPLMELNKEAVQLQKSGDLLGAVAIFGKLFERARICNLYHAELHVCHTNRAAALLALELWDEALWDAQRAAELAMDAMKRCDATCAEMKMKGMHAITRCTITDYHEVAYAVASHLKHRHQVRQSVDGQ